MKKPINLSGSGEYIFLKFDLKMKFSLLFFIITLFQLQAGTGNAQKTKITLEMNSVSIKEVMTEIESISDFKFFYSKSELDLNRKVSIRAKKERIENVLNILFDTGKIDYKIIEKQIVLVPTSSEGTNDKPLPDRTSLQDVLVTGMVVDENGTPLPGASIVEKGTTNGTQSDFDGKFSITLKNKNAVLVVSYIGFTTKEINVNGQTYISVRLQVNAAGLDEVVVVGYTSKQLSNISGSVSVVSGEQLNNDVTSNDVTGLLQGKVPGLIVSHSSGGHPNGVATPIIRGSSSITAGSAPLYVVDGIIGGSANPNDVESVTVLKDAALTGLYGSRAANGVIIITTKKGAKGKTRINLSSTTGFNTKYTGHFKVMNSQQLYDYQKSFFAPAEFESSRPSSLLLQNTDWVDLAFRTGITRDYTLSVSGGSEKTKFYTSANYYQEQGTLKNTGNEAYNLRTNVSYQINSKLKLDMHFNGSFRKYENDASGSYGALYGAFTNMPWDNPYNSDGSLKMGNEAGWIGREQFNFLQSMQYNYNRTKRIDMTGDLNLVYEFNPNLTFSTFNRASYQNSKNATYYDTRTLTGLGTSGKLSNSFANSNKLITSNRLEYRNNFGNHYLNLLAVGEIEKNYADDNSITGQGLTPGLAVMDVASTILGGGGGTNESAFSKGLIQTAYNYDKRYFIVGSFVNESSSRFGANNRSANFYTLAGSWILSNEQFMRGLHVFDFLKIRASYGLTGNAQISNYQSLGLYAFSDQYAGFSASVPSRIANDDLTWEKANTTNLGLDVKMFKRFSMNIDLYDKTTHALLLNVPLAYTSGYSSTIKNVGSVQNRGVEINLNSDNLTGRFKWKTNFNIAFNKNKVLELYEGTDITKGKQRISVGRDINSWYMRKWAGVDPQNGDPLWEIATTQPDGTTKVVTTNSYSAATLQYVGLASPKFTGGITNSFIYEGFKLTGFLNFVSGNLAYNHSREFFDSDGSYQTYNNMVLLSGWSRWQQPGDITTHPKPVTGGNKLSNKPSSRYMEDGSYLRLRNITFSYQLPEKLLDKVKIAEVELFVSGDNLWTGTHFSGMNPEVLLGPGGGTSSMQYPISKRVLLGINVKF